MNDRTPQYCAKRELSGLYPQRMFINRGNHEAKDMNRAYGFEGEAKHKHGEQTYKVSFVLTLSGYHSLSRHSYLHTSLQLVSSRPHPVCIKIQTDIH